jgi:hypothetical protein
MQDVLYVPGGGHGHTWGAGVGGGLSLEVEKGLSGGVFDEFRHVGDYFSVTRAFFGLRPGWGGGLLRNESLDCWHSPDLNH